VNHAAAAVDIGRDLAWLATVLERRLRGYFDGAERFDFTTLPPPALGNSAYGDFARGLATPARLALILALTPHVRPQLLDVLWQRNDQTQRGFTEFGGWVGTTHGGFFPTGETAVFLVAGDDIEGRFAVQRLIGRDGPLAAVLQVAPVAAGEPVLSGPLLLNPGHVARFTTGDSHRPHFGADFPALRIETSRAWSDLVLPRAVLGQLEEIKDWVDHGKVLLHDWQMAGKIPAGCTALFHGPPGTGKTLSACLLGKLCDRDVYRIDLSMVVSKYIGETEKNLARVFDAAERQGWILFFDEADALFGQRTTVSDAHDRYANQEVSFLLQRVETFAGVVVLASNRKANIDEAFLRRFHAVIAFPVPQAGERERIWRGALSRQCTLAPDVQIAQLASQHAVSGGVIMNVVRFASLKALARGDRILLREDLEEGIRRELAKEGRSV
jgi:hypothetical protein